MPLNGVDGVVHNYDGFLMGAIAKQEACDIFVLVTKLMALKTRLELALDDYLFPLIVESNCLEAEYLMKI